MAAQAWRDDTVVIDGARVHYTRTGGDNPPLVLAHGYTDNALCWTRVAEGLEADFDVIMVDARGHGQSELPEEAYSATTLADDLVDFIHALGLERPAVVGHSMGAHTAALAAANHPDVFRCVALEDPPWFSSRPSGSFDWSAWMRGLRAMTPDELSADCRRHNPNWHETEVIHWAQSRYEFNLRVFDLSGFIPTGWDEFVPKITIPTLLLMGDVERGALVTPEVATRLTQLNANVQVAQIPHAGHSIHRDQYEPYMAALTRFLRAHLIRN